MSYDSQISSLRELARDMRRLEKTENLRNKRAFAEADDKNANESLINLKKSLEAETYDLSKLDTAHPLYEDNKKVIEKTIEMLNKAIESDEKATANTKKVVDDLNKAIADVQNGEWKCDLEDLDAIVKDVLIPAIMTAAAVKKTAEVKE